MKKLVLIGLVLLFIPLVSAYCNETQIITHENESLASSDYNVTITRTCTEENVLPAIVAVSLFGVILLLTGLILLWFKRKE